MLVLGLLLVVAGCRFGGWIEFFSPGWLALLMILPYFTWVAIRSIAGLPARVGSAALTVRSILFMLLVFCLADIQYVLKDEGLCVLFLMDHSASIPDPVRDKQLQYVNEAAATKGRKDTVGIVVFGENSSVEVMPVKSLKVDHIYSAIDRNHTDLQGAIETATTAFPANARKKIVLLTDGNENQGNLLDGIRFAAGNHVVTDVLPVTYNYDREVLVEKVYLPDKVHENETFDLRTQVISLQDCPAELTVFRNGICVAKESVDLKQGRNTYSVALKIQEAGFYAFTAKISAKQDTISANNEAAGYVYIQGESRVMLVAPTEIEVRHLAQACREDNLEATVVTPDHFPDSLGMLQNYDCILIANVPADELGGNKMGMIHADVRDLGVGLVMLGGESSFGAGGYEGTPLEEALPVTMDIKQKKINPKGALVLILHTCEFPDGNYWAKQISKKAIETVNPQDEVGVLLYGNREEWLFDLRSAENKKALYAKIDQASPGDMPSFAPAMQLAHDAFEKTDAMVKHMIIISDGDPSPPDPKLIKDMAAAGITISTVAISPHSPRDVDVMKYMAYETGGRYYFAENPEVLPRIFVKEAKVVKRSLIFNKKFQPLLMVSTEITKGIAQDEIPPLMAYVATTPKPMALVPMVSDNENHDPILAYWRCGLGKSVAFTSDASVNWGKEWVKWEKYKKFWTQTIRWASRKRDKSDLKIHSEIDGGRGRLIIDAVDSNGRFLNFLKLNGRIVNPDNGGAPLEVRQTAPGRYEAEFDAKKTGVSIISIGYQNPQTGGQGFDVLGVSVPYSAEHSVLAANIPLLRQAVAAGGGRLLSGSSAKDQVFTSNQPPSRSFQPIWEFLLIAALVIFFIDVILRRVIVTRADVEAALVACGRVFGFKRVQRGEQDKTLAALLARKQKTYERVGPPAGEPGGFKERLDQKAATAKSASAPVVDPVAENPPDARTERSAKATSDAAGRVQGDAGAGAENSYTSRLLAAKKRAQQKKDND